MPITPNLTSLTLNTIPEEIFLVLGGLSGGDDATDVASALPLALSAAAMPTIPPRNTSNKELLDADNPDEDDVVVVNVL